MGALGATGEVVASGTALAGLMLIYIGIQVTNYGSYTATERKTVKPKFLLRASLAAIGVASALIAAALGLIAKTLNNQCLAGWAVSVAVVAFVWTILVAVANVREIK